jgi:predicted metal-dependent hydrolase
MEPAERQRLMAAGQQSFNDGDFFAAHEHWEAVWLATPGPERRWIQGLIQVATGLHKLAAARRDLCRGLLSKALAKLADAPARLDGLDVARLRQDATALALALDRGEMPDPRAFRVH